MNFSIDSREVTEQMFGAGAQELLSVTAPRIGWLLLCTRTVIPRDVVRMCLSLRCDTKAGELRLAVLVSVVPALRAPPMAI